MTRGCSPPQEGRPGSKHEAADHVASAVRKQTEDQEEERAIKISKTAS